ncbi:MAG: hypothetical protein FJ095_13720 [Deltaproteobacteria bacterium]|nr:hypothetical protein [Deltaproteobacteria bacterium]
MSTSSRNVAEDFEAWASLAARLRVASTVERQTLLATAGLASSWESLHEAWAAQLNAEIASGALERPNRYLALCAEQEARVPPRASATLVGAEAAALGSPLPFASGAVPSSAPSGARATSNESAAAVFAGLRASSAELLPPEPRGRAVTMLVGPTGPSMRDEEQESATMPAPGTEAETYERFLQDFRASLMPPSPVLPSSAEQAHTLATPAAPLLEAASRARAQELASHWPLERLAEFVLATSRLETPAAVDVAWNQQGIVRQVDREYVRSSLEIRLRRDPALAARFPQLAPRQG